MPIKKTAPPIIVLFLFVAYAEPAHAYIDMGTGSYVIQMVLAGMLSVGVALRVFWGRIKSFFNKDDKEDR